MASAKTAENALTQFVGGLRKINNTLWRASDPFAREFGRAAVEAIIAHTPMIAQNEMDAMTGKTESEFLALEELVSYNGQIGEYSPDRRDELLNKVDRFWEDFGDMLLASDYGAGPSDRKPHLLLAAVVNNPMRLIRALRTALSQTGSKDVEAQELLEGFRLFFQERASKGLGSFFKAIDDRLAAAQLWIEEQYEGASESMAAVS